MADDRPDPDLYERDFYAWTQVQARVLKSRDAGANQLDYEHLAEEVADLGKAERNTLRSHLRNIIVHLMLLAASKSADPRGHWKVEVLNFRAEAEPHARGALRRLIRGELDKLHERAAKLAQAKMALHEPEVQIDQSLRWTLPQILGEADDPLDDLR